MKILKVKDHASVRHALIGHRFVHQRKTLNWTHRNMTLSQTIHNRTLRNNQNIQITANAYETRNKIVEQASTVWNELSHLLKNTEHREKFKKDLANCLIDKY